MSLRSARTFTTIRTEGAILPADLLQRIARGNALAGLTPAAYHLAPGEKLNEATNQSWNHLTKAWRAFKEARAALSEGEPGTTITRRWLLALFQALNYGRLLSTPALEVEGKSYPISHGWGLVPIHLVGCGVDLDTRTAGVAGAARTSPHGLVQELLNRSDRHLWAFYANGLRLRILRDSARLTRQAYVEFDLEAMMDGEIYADFVLLWLLCHESRVEGESPDEWWLEKWSKLAHEEGARALDRLRDGVQTAIEKLGGGFLSHPANTALKDSLHSGQLDRFEFLRQVRRMVYRMVFLFVAEDREVLLLPDAPDVAKSLYKDYYSTAKLRHLSERWRGDRHSDRWQGVRLVLDKLGSDGGCPELALPALGSFLFSPTATLALNGCEVGNFDLLDAVRALSFIQEAHTRRSVDYKNLGTQELGGIYESLLELVPLINVDSGSLVLEITPGNERKTTGSFFTAPELVLSQMETALDPVIAEARHANNPEEALLNLKVCDGSCGLGSFLISAAHRIAHHLAAFRSGEAEPSPSEIRRALHDVVGRCIYGVDINPDAVEFCRFCLWLESVEPGKPLSFLDHHIQCGNSLLGTTPALLEAGIPDDAFKPLAGDDRTVCSGLKRRNREERDGGQESFRYLWEPFVELGDLARSVALISQLGEDKGDEDRRAERYAEIVQSAPYRNQKLLLDAWCAAFVCYKTDDEMPVTTETLQRLRRSNFDLSPTRRQEIERLARQYGFFHWHLAFPDVFKVLSDSETNPQTGWSGGFDCLLGNPPWERIKIQEREWFAVRRPDIAGAANTAARRLLIRGLQEQDPDLWQAWQDAQRQAEGESHFVRSSGRYPLCGRGDINTYTLFVENDRILMAPTGRVGCITPSGIATDDTTKFFFQDIMETRSLVSLYSFENEEFIFPAVHHFTRFCLLTLSGSARPVEAADFLFYARRAAHLTQEHRHFTLTASDVALMNPNTHTGLVFRSNRDAELTKAIYRRVPVLIREEPPENPWGISFQRMLDMSNDSGLFRARERLEADGYVLAGNVFSHRTEDEPVAEAGELKDDYLPLYEAKMLHHFNHQWATYDAARSSNKARDDAPDVVLETRDLTSAERADPTFQVLPRYWVPGREARLRCARLPRELLQALREGNIETIVLDVAWRLFRQQLRIVSEEVEGVVKRVLDEWKAFCAQYPFARILSPTQLGLCGDNPPCFGPAGPDYLPAAPLGEIETGPRTMTAWYQVDPTCVNRYLSGEPDSYLETSPPSPLITTADVLAYAEIILKQATPKWLLGWRDITNTTNERTVIAGVLPFAGIGHKFPLINSLINSEQLFCLYANLVTFCFDYVARQKIGSTSLTYFYLKQLPVLPPSAYNEPCAWDKEPLRKWIAPRVLELTYTTWDLQPFACECGYDGPPFRRDEERRFLLRCELDAAYFHLYGIERDDVDYIMDTFNIVKRKDETAHGEYRTKRVILEIYDAMQRAGETDVPYQTRLDPPPADPRVAHPPCPEESASQPIAVAPSAM